MGDTPSTGPFGRNAEDTSDPGHVPYPDLGDQADADGKDVDVEGFGAGDGSDEPGTEGGIVSTVPDPGTYQEAAAEVKLEGDLSFLGAADRMADHDDKVDEPAAEFKMDPYEGAGDDPWGDLGERSPTHLDLFD